MTGSQGSTGMRPGTAGAAGSPPEPVERPVGLETEYGALSPSAPRTHPVTVATQVVLAYAGRSRAGLVGRDGSPAPVVHWDYEGEDPLADMRGGRLERASAHPSLLTDDPMSAAPPAPSAGAEKDVAEPPGSWDTTGWGTDPGLTDATGEVLVSTRRTQVRRDSAHHPGATDRAVSPDHDGAGRGDGARQHDDPGCKDSGDQKDGWDREDSARPAGRRVAAWETRPRPSAQQAALPGAANVVLTSGARLYVDHAHPEYSSPEVLTPYQALVWDRAGEVVARRAMDALAAGGSSGDAGGSAGGSAGGTEVVLYKNNVDGKGASYGSHESYLVRRDVPFDDLSAALVPFLVTRPVYAGAGRVGIGQRSEVAGFQISQRADYVESVRGLQTTFNRPVINTRDEPHADSARFRRLHVINGDANRFDVPVYLKVAATSLVLWLVERSSRLASGSAGLADLALVGDPVEEQWATSHDTSLSHRLSTRGGPMTALEIQQGYHDAVVRALTEAYGGCGAQEVGHHTAYAVEMWGRVLGALRQWAVDGSGPAVSLVEWVAKLELCQALRQRARCGWDDPRLAALDIQWADLRQGRSVVDTLDAAGRVHRLVGDEEVAAAADTPPQGTRAQARGLAVARFPQVVGASWTSLVLDLPDRPSLLRLGLPDGVRAGTDETAAILQAIGEVSGPGGDWDQTTARSAGKDHGAPASQRSQSAGGPSQPAAPVSQGDI